MNLMIRNLWEQAGRLTESCPPVTERENVINVQHYGEKGAARIRRENARTHAGEFLVELYYLLRFRLL